MEIQLKKFDITQIKDDKVVVNRKERHLSKSFLCKSFILSWLQIYMMGKLFQGQSYESILWFISS